MRADVVVTAPLTAEQRKKGLVLPLSEAEAQVLRAMLGRTYDAEVVRTLEDDDNYPGALRVLMAVAECGGTVTGALYDRLDKACNRRELSR